jgi:hypothetical protein
MLQVKFFELGDSVVVSRKGLEPLAPPVSQVLDSGPPHWRLVPSIVHACTRCVPDEYQDLYHISFSFRETTIRVPEVQHAADTRIFRELIS